MDLQQEADGVCLGEWLLLIVIHGYCSVEGRVDWAFILLVSYTSSGLSVS